MGFKTFKQVVAAVALVGAVGGASAADLNVRSITIAGPAGGPGTYTFQDASLNNIATLIINWSGTKLSYSFTENIGDGTNLVLDYTNGGSARTLLSTNVSLPVGPDGLVAGGVGGAGATFYGATLTYTPITPVPEPESYAMLLAGLGLIGTIAIRRRNQNNA